MNTALSRILRTPLLTVALFAATSAAVAAATFDEGYVRLRFSDTNGGSLGRLVDGSVESDANVDGSRANYSIRMNANRAMLERCESGSMYLEYMAVPLFTDRRTGAVVHPNTQVIAGLVRAMSGAAVERLRVPFTFDATGEFQARDTLYLGACLVSDPRMAVTCGIKWSTTARIACD
jgi:hypothetical protein